MSAAMRVPIWHTHVPDEVRWPVLAETDRVLRSGRMVDGLLTRRLEKAVGTAFDRTAVAVASGMDALELLLEAMEPSGRQVLIPANCFPAIPALALRLGAQPCPVPIDPVHLAIDRSVTEGDAERGRPPLVLWVHHAGMVASYARTRITALRAAGCTVIEDCAYLLPADRPVKGPGTWGDAAILSFAPTKPLSGSGGGLVLTDDADLAETVRARRSHSGQEAAWAAGDRFHRGRTITEPAAALAYAQWQHRPHTRRRLRHLARLYVEHFTHASVDALPADRDPSGTWGRFTIDLVSADAAKLFRQRMGEDGIGTSVMFEQPWSRYPAFPSLPAPEQDGLLELLGRSVAIPYHPTLPFTAVRNISDHLSNALPTRKGTR